MRICLLFVLVIFSLKSMAQATATTDGNWSNTGSWSGGNIGDGGEAVTSNVNVDLTILNGETFTIASFNVGKDGSLTINVGGVLIITGDFIGDKDYTLNIDGDLTIQGDLNVQKNIIFNVTGTVTINGNVTLAKDASLDIQGSLTIDGDFDSDKDAIVNVDGSLDVGGDLDLGNGSTITGGGTVAVGSCSGAACGDSQLPIELVYFKGTLDSNRVIFTWATASEENNDFFTIEKSNATGKFEAIDTIDGAGNSLETIEYTYSYNEAPGGSSYYRLKQTDFDGKFTYSDVIVVNNNKIQKAFSIYPNPSNGEKLTLLLQNYEEGKVYIALVNSTGASVYSGFVQINGLYQTKQIALPNNLERGIYFFSLSVGVNKFSKKLLIH